MAPPSPSEQAGPEIEITRTVAGLRQCVRRWRSAGESVGLVPTMGALHEGHLALVREVRARCDRAVVSIFVNPSQFGAAEDLDSYPRDEADDTDQLARLGVDLVFAPPLEEIYGPGFSTSVSVGGVTERLCGAFRPGHFEGVATVVTKLLLQCLPDIAAFGEKDYQQLQCIRRLVRDLDIPVEIVAVATVRDQDGMALSSRNAKLSAADRRTALSLSRVLGKIAETLAREPGAVAAALADGMKTLEAAGFESIDYLEVCDAESLEPVAAVERPARVLAAAQVGGTRLIDNLPILAPD